MGSILKPERGLAWGGAVAGAVLGLMAPAVTATPTLAAAFDDCAAEAASQWEAGFETIGKDLSGIDTKAAIAACQKALKADDSSMQVKTWLGRAYYADSQDSKAVPLLEEAAKDGNLLALATFGDMLVMGTGVDKDMERGAGLLQEAADQGFAPAQNSLGLSYDYGDGVDQDYYQAQRWYRAAAEQGLPRAESNLGLMYQEGLGLERDYIAAAAWFARAADHGDASGQVNLGKLYQDGLGV
ncbi:MAG: sel1 repeat family protein, partial [Devosia nanyangense]|nr:sel1 repeat family protein [Devosia nanyangense]